MARTLDGRYRLTRFVASGATGEVWQAVDAGTDRPVAVKLLHPYLAADRRLRDRLRQARRALTGLWHPGIARLIDVVETDGVVALVTDFVPGTDLAALLASAGPLSPAQAARIGTAMADALSAAHSADMVHGDLKPANVMVPAPDGEDGEPVRVTDFSLATLVHLGWADGHPNGASPYAAPWMIDGAAPTPASDVHALGVVLFEMVTGTPSHRPGHADPVDRRLLDVVERCVLGEQAARPSAEAVAQRLRELAPQLSRLSPRPTPLRPRAPRVSRSRAHRHESRRRGLLFLGGAVAVVLLVITVAVVRLLTEPEPTASPGAADATAAATSLEAPATPPEASAPTQDGGGEFIRYWFAAFTYAVRTGDSAGLVAATSPDCQECQAAIETIDAAYLSGGSLRGGEYLVRQVTASNLYFPERPVYDAVLDRSPRTTVDAAGEVDVTLPPLTFGSCVVVLEWIDVSWRVREVVTPGCIG